MITIRNEQDYPIAIPSLKKDIRTILSLLGYTHFDLGVLLATEKHMQEINKQYRNLDKPTDILAFPYHTTLKAGEKIQPQTSEEKNLGDLILCPYYVAKDLERWGQSFPERITIVLVHGICHLLGYDHIKDEDYVIMNKKEQEILSKFSSKNSSS